jgi:hypothetical protein
MKCMPERNDANEFETSREAPAAKWARGVSPGYGVETTESRVSGDATS